MNNIEKAIIAGVCFAAWPLLMNRSGLQGAASSTIISIAVLVGVLPFALYANGLTVPQVNSWTIIAIACVLAAFGMLSFTSMLSNTTRDNVSLFLVVMTLVQIAVASMYQTAIVGHLSWDKGCGYATAALAAYLLLR